MGVGHQLLRWSRSRQLDRDAWKAERRAEPLARYEQGAKGESAENKPDFPVRRAMQR